MDNIITLDGQDFLITNQVEIGDKPYLFVIALDDSRDFTILEEYEKEDGQHFVKSVTDKNIIVTVLDIINKEGKEA